MILCWRLMSLGTFQNIVSSQFIGRSRHTDLRRALLLVSIAALLGNLAGCVFLPIPVARSAGAIASYRSNIDDQVPATLMQGSATRRQVLLDLGEPDGRGAADRWFTYQSVSRRGGLHWAYIAGAEGGAGSIGSIDNWDTARRLTIRFDDRGVVSSVAFDRKNCTDSFLDSATCPSASGKDLTKADEEHRRSRN
jgi:outer membrane protein assembly factor BamE (lipoprotein component of BamABCDE complex)